MANSNLAYNKLNLEAVRCILEKILNTKYVNKEEQELTGVLDVLDKIGWQRYLRKFAISAEVHEGKIANITVDVYNKTLTMMLLDNLIKFAEANEISATEAVQHGLQTILSYVGDERLVWRLLKLRDLAQKELNESQNLQAPNDSGPASLASGYAQKTKATSETGN